VRRRAQGSHLETSDDDDDDGEAPLLVSSTSSLRALPTEQ